MIRDIRDRQRPKQYRALAWASLILFPISFALAFIVGESIPGLVGAPVTEQTPPPSWVMAVTLLIAAVIFALPLLLTWQLSSRAAAVGEPAAWLPLILGAALAAFFILVNLVSGLRVLMAG